jgi:hypothetical protein
MAGSTRNCESVKISGRFVKIAFRIFTDSLFPLGSI